MQHQQNSSPAPDILLEQGAVLVFNKPGGLLTQAPPGIDSLELRAKRWLKIRDKKPGKVYLAVTHRLDRPVSGAIVMAKNVRAAKRIAEQFQQRAVRKLYWAIVEGSPPESTGRWVDPMRKIPDQAKSEIVAPDHPEAKQAVLNYRVLGCGDGFSFLEINLETGRTHQIRLQCAARGFPIAGDELYGATTSFGPQTDDLRKRWIALHARTIAFEHPIQHEPVEQVAPLPSHWNQFSQFEEVKLDRTRSSD